MKFVYYEEKNRQNQSDDSRKQIGIYHKDGDKIITAASVLGHEKFHTMQELIEQITEAEMQKLRQAEQSAMEEQKDFEVVNPEDITLLAPIEKPVHDILCVGVNYSAHRQEAADDVSFQGSEKAVFFSKRASKIIGSGAVITSRLDLDAELDYEVELAVIIGKCGTDIPKDKAEDYIFGYSVFNDISSRKFQRAHGQWFKGKSLDSYSAMGPVIVTRDELPFPIHTDVRSYLNGELRQNSNTSLFLADIPTIVSELSAGMELVPGDIIATGTPSGVGMGMRPQGYMKLGDEIVCEIAGVGSLKNVVGQADVAHRK